MPVRPYYNLNADKRQQIIHLYNSGHKISTIASRIGVTRRTVYLWMQRYRVEGNVDRKVPLNRPRVTTPEQDQQILTMFWTHGKTTQEIAKRLNISADTIRRRIREVPSIHKEEDPELNLASSSSNTHSTSSSDSKLVENITKHSGVICACCNSEIAGNRYTCLQCLSVDLCSSCEAADFHPQHVVLRLPTPNLYEIVLPYLEPVKNALNVGLPEPLQMSSNEVNDKKKVYQNKYREQNREKLKQREAERRKRKRYLQVIAEPSTSSHIHGIELNNEGITDANSQSLSGLEGTQTTPVQINEQDKEKNALQKKRLRQQRYREQNREKLKQLAAERRQRQRNTDVIIAESSTSSNVDCIDTISETMIDDELNTNHSIAGSEGTLTLLVEINERLHVSTAHINTSSNTEYNPSKVASTKRVKRNNSRKSKRDEDSKDNTELANRLVLEDSQSNWLKTEVPLEYEDAQREGPLAEQQSMEVVYQDELMTEVKREESMETWNDISEVVVKKEEIEFVGVMDLLVMCNMLRRACLAVGPGLTIYLYGEVVIKGLIWRPCFILQKCCKLYFIFMSLNKTKNRNPPSCKKSVCVLMHARKKLYFLKQ